jgi:hypothetical protein
MRSKVILSVMVCLALLLSLGVVVKDAKADAIMFPWVTKSNSVSTIISVVNTAGVPVAGVYSVMGIPLQLHYQYIYKNTTDYSAEKASTWLNTSCLERDFSRPTSQNDIVTFDAAGKINGGKPMFSDVATGIDASLYSGERFDMGDGIPGPRRAYLLVDNNNAALSNNGNDDSLYGEAIVMELDGGGAWGYIAYNASGGEGVSQSDPVAFSDGYDLLGEVINNRAPFDAPEVVPEYSPVVLLSPNDVKTRFYVTPISANIPDDAICKPAPEANQRYLDVNTAFQFNTMAYNGSGYDFVGGIYDNNEQPLSFTTPVNVTCTAAINLDLIIDPGVYVPWKSSGHQGWTYVQPIDGTAKKSQVQSNCYVNSSNEMVIGKLEYTESAGNIQGTTANGAINNFIWLRNSQSITNNYSGLNGIYPVDVLFGP